MKKIDKGVGMFVDKSHADKSRARWKTAGIRTRSSFFGMDKLLDLLSTPGATGLRIHYGIDEEGNMQPLLTAELEAGGDVQYLNASFPCPPFCPTDPPDDPDKP